MYEVLLTTKAKKQLKKLESKTRQRIISTLKRVRIRPGSYLTKVVGDPSYKLRVGDYRLIIDLDKGKLILLVLKMGHRKKIYKDIN